jgi:DNA-dependent protein kinase catalytic subunit
LGSIRKPKRLTINGSNEKEYDLLVKGGEDLRLDQRVQQVFKIMNKCFSEDPNCHNRRLKLSTFQVVPMTNRAGVLEWINNTSPLKHMIEKQMGEGKSIAKTRANVVMRKWLNSLNSDVGIQDQHILALKAEREDVVKNFLLAISKFPKYMLREGIKSTCNSPEIFLNKRANFIKSYACLCIGGYILGIGDRHLENFLISLNSGYIYAIDFGIAFDSGLHLNIPELIPFRMTSQIQDLVEPYSLKGHMKHALYALRK